MWEERRDDKCGKREGDMVTVWLEKYMLEY